MVLESDKEEEDSIVYVKAKSQETRRVEKRENERLKKRYSS